MMLTPIERVDSISVEEFERHFAAAGRPVVMCQSRNGNSSIPCWTMNGLIREFGHISVPVRPTDDEFLAFFSSQPEAATQPRVMELRAYVDIIEEAAATGTRPPYAGNIRIAPDLAAAQGFERLLSGCSFPSWQPSASASEYRLWMGAARQRSTIHNDPHHNFNAQLIGHKRFILFAPNQHGFLYPTYFHRGMWASPIDPLAPDMQKYPKFAEAQGFDCTLSEGELIYVPRFWWHYVEAMTISVNINRWVIKRDKYDDWWHQQQVARPFVSYQALLQHERSRFAVLPLALQESWRTEFQALEADFLRMMRD
ncbi:MAG: cupin-like domain-containing protein [Myxococcales bacterium]|nr:cupin-like domain-containing protein [Myxococcales bacterium]